MAAAGQHRWFRAALLLLTGALLALTCLPAGAAPERPDPNPPAQTILLVFIHHSCGENWLSDDDGGLGLALGANNYYVSDTNYGWGPDSIGDRTDITDWLDWFTGPDSGRYLAALYRESGQNSRYRRTLPDPGGENQVILFKSCFPNSKLEGEPYDPPARGDGLTVSNAKAIYQGLLAYFATRPDKLFIAITAPPVQDPSYAANARAFNTWLVTEWLAGYPGDNVAVFDFYNLLTGRDNHHRYRDGEIEYVTDRGRDTLAYPSDDDHPSRAGNHKATEELVPLLNVYVNAWLSATARVDQLPTPGATPTTRAAGATLPPPPAATPTTGRGGVTPPLPAAAPDVAAVIADLESAEVEWSAFTDDTGRTQVTCLRDTAHAHSGAAGLAVEFQVADGGWGSCSLVYPGPQDWSDESGLVLYLQAGMAGVPLVVVAYGGTVDSLQHFELRAETAQAAVDGWQRLEARWEELLPPEWDDGSARLDPARSMGMALLFDGADGQQSGRLWIDDVSLLPAATPIPRSTPRPETAPEGGRPAVCGGTAALVALAAGGLWGARGRKG